MSMDEVKDADALVFTVAHEEFAKLGIESLRAKFKKENAAKVLIDVKGLFNKKALEGEGFLYWSL